MCDVIDLIDKDKPIKDPFLREFIQDSNFIAFCNVFEPTKVYESDDSAGTLNKKIALLILGGLVNDRLHKLDKVFDLKNKFFIRLKELCLKNYETYLATIDRYQLKNNIKDGAPFFSKINGMLPK